MLRRSPFALDDPFPRVLRLALAGLFALSGLAAPEVVADPRASAAEPVDWEMVTRIRDEGFHRSQVMATLEHLTETIGPRLTGSPQMTEANQWTRDHLAAWGLENARLEPFDFGRGWSFSRASVHMIEPRATPLSALPEAWTSGTRGTVRGEVVRVKIDSEEDFERYRGELAGKILLLEEAERPRPPGRPAPDEIPRRLSREDLDELATFPVPDDHGGAWRDRMWQRRRLRAATIDFFLAEKALATLRKSSRDDGILRLGAGGSREAGDPRPIPGLMLAAEHWRRIGRLLDAGVEVELAIEVEARFHAAEQAFNTLAEIPGSDARGEVVMAGAHLDSWHAGSGATDNAAGVAVMMEAVRILAALGVEPKRTIRIALWGGEEQGLLGSRAHVERHYGSRPEAEEGENPYRERWPLTLGREHDKLSLYLNLDNGAGKVRGVFAQQNAAAKPIFEAWLAPFADLGAETVTLRDTRGTDHQAFDAVGLPGFQLIQDPLDYFAKTHHTNLDGLDMVEADDLKQASVVVASLLYHAAMRDQRMPRKPLPRAPEASAGGEDGEDGAGGSEDAADER